MLAIIGIENQIFNKKQTTARQSQSKLSPVIGYPLAGKVSVTPTTPGMNFKHFNQKKNLWSLHVHHTSEERLLMKILKVIQREKLHPELTERVLKASIEKESGKKKKRALAA